MNRWPSKRQTEPPPDATVWIANDGAAHLEDGPRIGIERDMEADGNGSLFADGDDTAGQVDDEDGVTFATLSVGQLDAQATVTISNVNSDAFLDAWIDFNQDGDFQDEDEVILELESHRGMYIDQFTIPAFAKIGAGYCH